MRNLLQPRNYYALACLVLWVSLIVILKFWSSGQETISYVAAVNRLTRTIFAIALFDSAVLTALFLQRFFFKRVKAGRLLRGAFYFAVGAMIGAGAIPATSGEALRLHTVFATILALSLVAVALLLTGQHGVRKKQQFLAGLVATGMVLSDFIITGIAGQLTAIALFNILILKITYSPRTTE